MRLVYYGTPALAVPPLDRLVSAGSAPLLVVTRADRPRGRGMKTGKSAVREAAESLGLPVATPARAGAPEELERIRALSPDLLIVTAYGQILPPALLEIPRSGALNVHFSLLPRHRGASPVSAALLAGDRETGVTTMWMTEGLDEGPIFLSRPTPIREDEDAGTLGSRLALLGADCLAESLARIERGEILRRDQEASAATYAPKLAADAGRLTLDVPADEFARRVRAFTPDPGAYLPLGAGRLSVLVAEADEDAGERAGEVVALDRERGMRVALRRGIGMASTRPSQRPPRHVGLRVRERSAPQAGCAIAAVGGGRVKRGRPAGRPQRRRTRRAAGARDVALQILLATESRSAYSDRLLETRLREARLTPSDAALVTALVQGTLRNRSHMDHHLAAFTNGGFEGLPAPIRAALRLGAFQILFLTRVPESAAVDESVELAKTYGHPGTAGIVNAVLRRLAKGERAPLPDPGSDLAGNLSILHSHPRWLVERWIGRYGADEASRLLAADNTEPSVSVRANAHRIRPDTLAAALRAEGHESAPGPNGGPVLLVERGYVASRSALFREGALSLQDEAESAVVPILDPRPGERVLDLCAAPGGKSSQIAERVAPGGRVIAAERHPSRARALRENLVHRLRLPGVSVVCGDGARPPFVRPFDRVLVDAPCTGLGVLRRRADARWRKEERSISDMAELQGALLRGAAPLTRSGGVLVYSVCSLEPEETDEIVAMFLRAHSEFMSEDVRPFLPAGFAADEPVLRAFPHRHGTDGVFAARLRRR